MNYWKTAFVLSVIAAGTTWCGVSFAATENRPIKNIVRVHGAFVDGSGWKPGYDILDRDEYNVIVVQQPLTSLADCETATNSIISSMYRHSHLFHHLYYRPIYPSISTIHTH